MIGGWALFTQTLLTDLDPAKVKIVAVDALPVELAYVEKVVGHPCCSPSRLTSGATSP